MFATIDQLKAELQISGTSQDDRLTLLLAAASSAIEAYCGRPFARATLTEQISPRGRQVVNLSLYPVVSIASVTMGSYPVTDYQLDAESGQLWRSMGWTWAALTLPDITQDPDPNMADRNLTVAYTAGYILPGSPGADLPAALQYAAVRVAATMYSRPAGFKSERTPGGYSYDVGDMSSIGFLGDVAALLDPYRAQSV
jgi:uncharacterized phiE125 gp8 family phage protein